MSELKPSTTTQPAEKNPEKKSEKNSNSIEARLAELAYADFNVFYEQILGYDNNGQGMPRHQEQWGDILQDNDKVLLLAPACHGKSTLTSVGYPLWEVARDRQIRIGIIANSDDLAEDILVEIKSHMEDNDRILRYFGKLKPDRPLKWNKLEIRVEGGVTTLRKKDATISVGGPISSWKGKRLDLLLGDDMVDERNASTMERARQLIDWFWETLYTRLEPWGRVKLVGTVEKEYDFYHDLIKNPRGFNIVHQKAIIDELKKEVLWPEKWTYDKLCELRSNNFPAFMKHFQNIVVSAEVAKLDQARIDRCFDQSIGFYPHGIPDTIRSQFKMIFMSVDPAWTRGKRSKYSVIMTIGWRHDGRRQVLDVARGQWEYNELFGMIKTKYNIMRPSYVIVETNQMQARLEQEIRECAIPTIPTFTSDRKNDIGMGIPMLYSVVGTANLILPCSDKISRDLGDQLINELLSWPDGKYSDILMAWYFIEDQIMRRNSVVKVVNQSVINKSVRHGSRFGRYYGLR